MATYDVSSYLVGNVANHGTLITNINKLGASISSGTHSTLLSTASTTYVSLGSVSKAVEADDLIMLVAKVQFSSSDGVSSLAKFRFYQDSTALTTEYPAKAAGNDTGGAQQTYVITEFVENLTGTFSFSIRFARSSGAGTIYSTASQINVVLFKKR